MMILLAAMVPYLALGCTYGTYNTYNRCNNVYCASDYQCESNNCDYYYYTCESNGLPPWAISLIVFFSVFIFISIIKAICTAQKRRAIIIRNQESSSRNSSSNEVNHQHFHHQEQVHGAGQKLIVTGGTAVAPNPTGAPVLPYQPPQQYPQPSMQPYQQPYKYPG